MSDIWATDGGVYFGQRCEAPSDADRPLAGTWKPTAQQHRYTGDRHLITFGPNGSGKTRRLLVPNLHYLKNWSVVVVDPKGSLAAMTGAYRAGLKNSDGSPHKVVVVDPFHVLEKNYPGLIEKHPELQSAGYNPVAALDPTSEDFEDDAKSLADALIQVAPNSNEPHFAQSAQALVKGLLLVARIAIEDGRLPDLRYWLGLEPDVLAAKIRGYKTEDGNVPGWLASWAQDVPAIAATLSRFAKISPDSRELLSILSTAQTQTDWLDSKPVCADLESGAYDFATLKETPTTVYLIIPPNRLATHATWLRIMLTAILTPLLRTVRPAKVPVLMMLDEFAQLGPLPVIQNNLGLMREYGVKLWPIFQDLPQAKTLYPDRWESFIGNAGVLHAFAPQDDTTRDYLSKMSGQRLYWLKTVSASKNQTVAETNSTSSGLSESYQNMQGPVYWPQNLAAMGQGQAVLYANGQAPRSWLPDPTEMDDIKKLLP